MDWQIIKGRAVKWINKYRFVLLILAIGIVLMSIPGNFGKIGDASSKEATQQASEPDVATQLTQILSQIQGVGQVRVMLTVSAGEKTIYQEDQDSQVGPDSSDIRTDTVIITDSDRTQHGLVSQVMPPSYLGAIIVCQGGDIASVKLAVLDAVSKITGLSADKISVLKMK